ncbi:hypothetical protein KJ980_07035 [Patescibacteria group bacterium]|nr:hypothetical protein [Patescibacteria group bacterium]MBU4016135.1 hypothetical protein [Patescibacteria group bacterium]MBU4099375.1 hypothetical protein [Patescibacteria group bacterium]
MDISKFIKDSESPYDNRLETKIENVEKLVRKNVISSQFGKVLMAFLIKKEVSESIKHNLEHILHTHQNKGDRWFFVNFSKKRTCYI